MSDDLVRLVVFADDWGRHPSSCQHLVRCLLGQYHVVWVNTVGTRRPRVSWSDARRAVGALRRTDGQVRDEAGPTILRPRMYPGFRNRWQRRLNAVLLARQINRVLDGNRCQGRTIAITTLPISADLVGRLHVDRWVYYCVDDFSRWPGLDAEPLRAMEAEQVSKVDAIVAAGDNLAQRVLAMHAKVEPMVLTHGVDLGHWQGRGGDPNGVVSRTPPEAIRGIHSPIFLFWGLIDRRVDVAACEALARAAGSRGGTLVMVGPQQDADAALKRIEHLVMLPADTYDQLPRYAFAAEVLVMPYRDSPVTRAMQPLKLKEYLATGKPAVVRALPATRAWADAADVVDSAQAFAATALNRLETGLPSDQATARRRLEAEAWSEKARQFMKLIMDQPI